MHLFWVSKMHCFPLGFVFLKKKKFEVALEIGEKMKLKKRERENEILQVFSNPTPPNIFLSLSFFFPVD